MANEFDRVERFEKKIENSNEYISNPTSFLYDQIEDPTLQEIVECTRAIALSNLDFIENKRESNKKMLESMTGATAIIATPTIFIIKPSKKIPIPREVKDLSEIINKIIYDPFSEESKNILRSLSPDDLKLLKLQIYKLILDTKREIRKTILTNPTTDISLYQERLNTYEVVLEVTIKEFEEAENTTLELSQEYSNIILVPNNKKSTYLYEDIIEYPERYKEIRLIFEKIVDGYFLRTKDTKPIEGYQEKIYEYKHPNGIRILYVITGNVIVICSFFMKDKQKSTRISNEYEEALSRYYSCKDYIENNYNNPDFHIEQAEFVEEIFSQLDGMSLSKKVGE
ncbi:MAG: hypothetical protein ACI4XM_00670 [Candidatus Coprovivens sp.]